MEKSKAQLERENGTLRTERDKALGDLNIAGRRVEYFRDRVTDLEATNRVLVEDRSRLIQTIEVLSRRLASPHADRRYEKHEVNQMATESRH